MRWMRCIWIHGTSDRAPGPHDRQETPVFAVRGVSRARGRGRVRIPTPAESSLTAARSFLAMGSCLSEEPGLLVER
ncbi:hypothetical protein chiPu_0022251 [Chiloscyllium punctatum]|uniref:Uncharacterized protein n=1 Tax=Chiloscyllium punctatum TaxID=137246 RepID=A0A401RFW8_CHIPU|nr:hypothetical protein [Chiloscyllium punctatum]